MATIYRTRKNTGSEKATTFRFSVEVHDLLTELAHCLRKPKVEVMELLIRDATKDFPQQANMEKSSGVRYEPSI